jgi:hypothetical protein
MPVEKLSKKLSGNRVGDVSRSEDCIDSPRFLGALCGRGRGRQVITSV